MAAAVLFYAADDLAARGLALLGAVLAGIASFYVIERPARSYLTAPGVVNAPARR
ncbi:MAG TPA: hypothetical protein VMU47_24685 [Caldimonas sp.]|nr:hypothetical protein [Caldimonas sp.]